MAQQYDNTNTGALFKNEDKETDKHPDYRGQINVGGEEFWLSAWVKLSKGGTKYMSLSVSPKEQKQQARPAKKAQQTDDSDVPF